MKTVYDVMQLLKTYGIFVYIGDRKLDLTMMVEELRELYDNNLLSIEEYGQANLILRKEISALSDSREGAGNNE
ncbi:hypothetical protein GZ22_09175 [Terribacillus saccharophilus]|uniref:Cytosolic protein n=1 Tax=Terribacillus saccharophilus TaxID=361277 RepID=A0A075LJ81_9BACI|nr:YqgQ family protein [Terribacillus goriensis]AIF66795.1 hypothetical protein GZ22_09175 [Terribacillus goriensis]